MRILSVQINNLITLLIIALIGLIPLVFSPLTTEYFDSSKIIFLVGTVVVLYLLWAFTWVLQGKVTFTKTPLDLPLILLLIVIVFSTIFSDSKFDAIFGNFPRVQGSAVSWIAYILFYFVAASHLKTISQVKAILYTLLFSATICAIVALLSYFNLYLPFDFAKVANFNLTGSSFSTAALLIMFLPFMFLTMAKSQTAQPTIMLTILSTFFLITIMLTGSSPDNSWLVLLSPVYLVLYLTLLISFWIIKKQSHGLQPKLFLPLIITAMVFVVGYLPAKTNPLSAIRSNFPREIQLPLGVSWQVSGQSFVKNPFLGSGPSTYGFNFTAYKDQDFNLTQYWNLPFDTATDEYLQILGTLGALGFLAFFAFSLVVLNFSYTCLTHTDQDLVKAIAISTLTTIMLLLVHAATPVTMIISLAFLAMLIGTQKQISGKIEELTIGIKATKITDSNLIVGDILPIIIFIPVFVGSLVVSWNLVNTVRADIYHRQALNAASSRGIDTYNDLVNAEKLNPYIALYRTDLAQTNFALANSLALSKGPTQASPSGSLTDADKQLIQQLLSQSVTEGRVATTLSPRNAQNWIILAGIYRQISGVAQNAIDFSLDAYGRAIQKDPTNPNLRLNVGGIYYSVKNYELAVRFFNDAANLKPDYANAFYNLSIALRDKGDLPNAYLAGQRVVALLQADPTNPDYQTANNYLADLKTKLDQAQKDSQSQVAGAEVTPPAADQNSALQKDNLPNVVDLGQKPQVATPAAVKKSSKVQATTAPSASTNP